LLSTFMLEDKVSLPVTPNSVTTTLLQKALDYHRKNLLWTGETKLSKRVINDHIYTFHINPKQKVRHPMLPFSESTCDEDADDCVCLARFLRWTNQLKEVQLKGQDTMKRTKAILAGLVHNNEKTLAADVNFLHRLGKRFLDYRILLVENDSSDGTPRMMNKICKDPRMICQLLHLHMPESMFWGSLDFHRFATLSVVRNKGLDHIRDLEALGQLDGFDVIIWIEMDLTEHNDGLNPMFELDSVATSFGRKDYEEFDLICANGVIEQGMSRDTLPLVSYEREFRILPRGGVWIDSVHELRDGVTFIQAESCFGGLGIYNLSTLLGSNCRYHPETGVCEHLSLHRCMKEHALNRIYINPTMIVYFESQPPHRCIQI